MSLHQAVVSHQAHNDDLFAFQGETGHMVMGFFFPFIQQFEPVQTGSPQF